MNVLQLKNSSFKGFETHNPLMEKIKVGSKNYCRKVRYMCEFGLYAANRKGTGILKCSVPSEI